MPGNFYMAVAAQMFSYPAVPTPGRLADWIAEQDWSGHSGIPSNEPQEWVDRMVGRLRAWPQGKAYPLIPDDEMLAEARRNPSVAKGWWMPGTPRGDTGAALNRTMSKP